MKKKIILFKEIILYNYMKLKLINTNIPQNVNDDFYMYWKCSLYERCRDNLFHKRYVGFSTNSDIIKKTVHLATSMKSSASTIGLPVITLHTFQTKQHEYVKMNLK